jgi:hypothetical protein
MDRSSLFEIKGLNENGTVQTKRAVNDLDWGVLAYRGWPVEVEVCDEVKAAFSRQVAYVVKKRQEDMRFPRDESWRP